MLLFFISRFLARSVLVPLISESVIELCLDSSSLSAIYSQLLELNLSTEIIGGSGFSVTTVLSETVFIKLCFYYYFSSNLSLNTGYMEFFRPSPVFFSPKSFRSVTLLKKDCSVVNPNLMRSSCLCISWTRRASCSPLGSSLNLDIS